MPIEDLDLEFEDEDEQKKKKAEALKVDVDLEFAVATANSPAPKAVPVAAPSSRPIAETSNTIIQKKVTPAASTAATGAAANIRPIGGGQAVTKKPDEVKPVIAAKVTKPATQQVMEGSAALKIVSEEEASGDVSWMASHVQKVEFEAEVKVAVAEYKVEILAEMLSDLKLFEHQINQLLMRIHQKHPDTKAEILAIKKALADLAAKKRK